LRKVKKKIETKYLVRRILCLGILVTGFFSIISMGRISGKKVSDKVAKIKNSYNIDISLEELKTIYNSLNIIKTDFKWDGELEKGNKPNRVILHHSAIENMTIEDIHNKHAENEWAGIGYHYFIGKDGKIYQGREENIIGAHVKKNNINTLGICLEGNFENGEPTSKQNGSLLELLRYLFLKYDISTLEGHRDNGKTLCPGEKLKVSQIKNNLDLLMGKEMNIK
jgi:N-acetylmuramoyl-L-alanine amidase